MVSEWELRFSIVMLISLLYAILKSINNTKK